MRKLHWPSLTMTLQWRQLAHCRPGPILSPISHVHLPTSTDKHMPSKLAIGACSALQQPVLQHGLVPPWLTTRDRTISTFSQVRHLLQIVSASVTCCYQADCTSNKHTSLVLEVQRLSR